MADDDRRPRARLARLARAVVELQRAADANRFHLGMRAMLTTNELRAMAYIAEYGHARPSELSPFLGMTTGAVTALSAHLARGGFLAKVPHPSDRRGVLLTLTPAGLNVMETIYRDYQAAVDSATSSLTSVDIDVLAADIEVIAKAIIAARATTDPNSPRLGL